MSAIGNPAASRHLFRAALLVALAPTPAVCACGNLGSVASDASLDDDVADAGVLETGRCKLCGPPLSELDGTAPRDAGVDAPVIVDASDSGVCAIYAYCALPPSMDASTITAAGPCNIGGDCTAYCAAAGFSNSCRFGGAIDGGLAVDCCYQGAGGRRPRGWTVEPGRAAPPLGGFFATLAQLEAVSIPAFERLRDELLAHDAPRSLVDRAGDAIVDERLHTKLTTALARRFGGVPTTPVLPPLSVRPLREVAVENAAEGCVRETFGALVAIYQAERAEDGAVRRAMNQIAADESRHAQLAWDVAAFCDDRLDERDRAAVRAAMHEAIATLRVEIARPPHDDLRGAAGLPPVADARRLLACLQDAVAERVS